MTLNDLQYKNFLPEIKDINKFEEYLNFLEKCKNRSVLNTYTEKHHIVPRCYLKELSKKERDFNNTIILTGIEHYEAHKLLSESLCDFKMTTTFFRMSFSKGQNGDLKYISAEEYQELRSQHALLFKEVIKKDRKNNPEKYKKAVEITKQKLKGKSLSEETKRKISESVSKTMTPEHKELLRQKSTDYKFTEEQKEKHRVGLIQAHKKKPYSKETLEKIKQSNIKAQTSIECIETGERFSLIGLSRSSSINNRGILKQKILNNEEIDGLHYFFYRKPVNIKEKQL